MSSFKNLQFTPQDFARIHEFSPHTVLELESLGIIKIGRKRVGNVDRKMISMEDVQEFFQSGRRGEQLPPDEKNPRQLVDGFPHRLFQSPKFKTQMFYNIKGGTGKSTLTAQVAMRAAMLGFKVLAIDLDGQGHLSLNLDVLDGHERPTIYDILINDFPVEQTILSVSPGLDLIPANLGLCNIEIPLNQKTRREYRLSEAIYKIKDQYDLIIADTNPAASILNCSMLVAADAVNVVCATNPLAYHGMSLVMSTLQDMIREFRKNLSIRVIPNMYDAREVISQEVLGELRAQLADYCTDAVVNRSVDLNEATKRRSSVLEVNLRGTGAKDINRLTTELIFGQEVKKEVVAPQNVLGEVENQIPVPVEAVTGSDNAVTVSNS